jgi:16S rRNA (uracil1498-N3)-methyltransferase
MRIPRVHVDELPADGAELALTPGAARHVHAVLRLRPGAPIVLFDGRGEAREAVLLHAARAGVRVRVGARLPGDVEAPLAVTLALGISRGERMDLALQKATELGVHGIVPLLTERSVVRLDGERAARRQAHWRGVVLSACEQCGRNRMPQVAEVQALAHWLERTPAHGLALMPHPGAAQGLRALAPAGRPVTLLIGPEGGLGEAERALAVHHGFTAVRLGPRVLRTETAVIAALAAVMTLWGDLAG